MLPLQAMDRIRERRDPPITQEQLAVAVGVTSSTLRNYAHGRPGRRADEVVARIAAELGCDVLELYGLQPLHPNGDQPGA